LRTVLLNMINRERFDYTPKDIVSYLLTCLCLKKMDKNRQKYKKHFFMEKGEEKLKQELDVMQLMKAVR
jgi:hypothetical protein